MNRFLKSTVVLSFLCFGIMEIRAEAWVPPAKAGRKTDNMSIDYGATLYDKDYYFHFSPNISYNLNDEFGISLSAPVNLLLVDNEPKFEKEKTGSLRKFDYNESNDYGRLVNYIWYGQYEQEVPGKLTYSLQVGDIRDGRVGHGTILNQYNNNIRHDIYNVGVIADLNSDYAGVQVFSNSITTRDVNVARAYIKPLALGRGIYHFFLIHKGLFTPEEDEYVGMMQARGNVVDEAGRKSVLEEIEERKKKKKNLPKTVSKYSKMQIEEKDEWYNRFTIGVTRAFDSNLPILLSYSQTGIPERKENKDVPLVSESGKLNIEGYDAEYRLLNMKYVEFTPYLDVNRIRELENSGGTHYGFMARFGDKDVNLIIKPELRKMSSNYIPMYFDSFYEVERFHGRLTSEDPMVSKFQTAQGLNTTGGISGFFHTIIFNYYGYSLEASYEDYSGIDNSRIFIASYIPIASSLVLSFFYTKKGFDGMGQAFKVDDASLGAVELSFPLGPMQLRLQNLRRWTFAENETGFRSYDETRLLLSSSYAF
jgi:hypothetical protein